MYVHIIDIAEYKNHEVENKRYFKNKVIHNNWISKNVQK